MNIDIDFMLVAIKAGLAAVPTTLTLAIASFAIGLVLGCIIAIIRVFEIKYLASFFKIVVSLVQTIPTVLILYIIYFILTDGFNSFAETVNLSIRSKDISVNFIAIVAMSFFSTVTLSETIRGSFASINSGQYEAGYSVGLTIPQTLKCIILPQVIPVAIPVLCNNLIGIIKVSSIMYLIAVQDILNASLTTATSNYRYLDAYIAAAIIYWGISLIIEQMSKLLEKRMGVFRRNVA